MGSAPIRDTGRGGVCANRCPQLCNAKSCKRMQAKQCQEGAGQRTAPWAQSYVSTQWLWSNDVLVPRASYLRTPMVSRGIEPALHITTEHEHGGQTSCIVRQTVPIVCESFAQQTGDAPPRLQGYASWYCRVCTCALCEEGTPVGVGLKREGADKTVRGGQPNWGQNPPTHPPIHPKKFSGEK